MVCTLESWKKVGEKSQNVQEKSGNFLRGKKMGTLLKGCSQVDPGFVLGKG